MKYYIFLILLLSTVLFCLSCSESRHASDLPKTTPALSPVETPKQTTPSPAIQLEQSEATIVRTLPHDNTCYTQGLEIHEGILYETGGLVGRSTLRKIDMRTWKILQIVKLPPEVFGEGLTLLHDKLYVLTWRDERCFIYNPKNLNLIGEQRYRGEGWGLCNDGESLIMTNGSNTISFLSPDDFHVIRSISVFDKNRAVDELNEIEYINGEIWANIYQTNNIVRINPQTGEIIGWIDAGALLTDADRAAGAEVLNGIACDRSTKAIYLTGKLWPKLFEVKLSPIP